MKQQPNYWHPLAVFYGLDWIKVSNDLSNYDAPYEIRNDHIWKIGDIERQFDCPRVDFSYKGKKYYGYIPVHTIAEKTYFFGEELIRHEYDDEAMLESLRKMIQDFLETTERNA